MYQAVENLEPRLLFALNPTPREQELLEMLNRMRLHPQAEYKILTGTKNQDVQDALNFFNVDLNVLSQQFAALKAVQPLAWNSALRDSAVLHSKAMLAADEQTHQAPGELDLAKRVKAAGYTDMSVAGENVFAFANSFAGAALRLRLVDHRGAQVLLRAVAPVIETVTADALARPLADLGGFAPLADVASAFHERAEARLFTS